MKTANTIARLKYSEVARQPVGMTHETPMSGIIKFAKAGGLDVVQFIETPVPAPGPHEVRQVQSDRRAESM